MIVEKKDVIRGKCDGCGNEGLMEVKGHYVDSYDEEDSNYWENTFYYLAKCPTCGNAVLISEYRDAAMAPDEESEVKQIYPTLKYSLSKTPNNISELFKSAIECLVKSKDICIVSLRMVVERICNERGATGKTLNAKIIWLSKKHILPKYLASCSHITRLIGNDGAHDKEQDIKKSDVKKIIEIVYNIIYYIYELPHIIDNFNKHYGLVYEVYEDDNNKRKGKNRQDKSINDKKKIIQNRRT